METQYADVWIIGSGAAGLMAGIAAAGAGARVGVIGKGAPGEGSATERAGGAFAGAWQGLGIEEQVERTMQSGRGINSLDLVRAFAADGPKRFQDLIDWGMPYRNTRGALRVLPPKGELGEIPMWSAEITRSLAARAGGLGVSFQNHTVVGKIEAGEAGVRLVAFGSEGPMELIGGAAVIAAGGAGGIYQHNDNPPGITGNAHALGLAAGAELRDMEFMQFYPMTINEPGKARLLFEPDEANQGRVLNDKGEDRWKDGGDGAVVRAHFQPRRELFTPARVPGAPPAKSLTAVRITCGTFADGREFRCRDDWTVRATAHKALEKPWTGTTTFLLKDLEGSRDVLLSC